MRKLSVLVVAGCSWEPQQPLDIDVVVARGRVAAYLNGSDFLVPDTVDPSFQFPALGTCVDTSDLVNVRPTCVERMQLLGDGFQVGQFPGREFGVYVPYPLPANLRFEIGGCGPDDVRIPLADVGLAVPTVEAERVGDEIHVTWTGSATWDSALVGYSTALGAHTCRTTGNTHMAAVIENELVGVTLLEAPEVVQASWGQARVWRGADAGVRVP